MVLMFMDTGVRLSGLLGLDVDDVDLRERTARVRLKGGRVITVPFGATTARAVDKYLRVRRRQRLSDSRALWLSGTHAGRLTSRGAQRMLAKHADRIGVRLHPHMFRHGFAHTWLSSGGSEGDLMELMGWRSRQMVARYGSALAADRAREAHRRLSPADNL
jgi:integrase